MIFLFTIISSFASASTESLHLTQQTPTEYITHMQNKSVRILLTIASRAIPDPNFSTKAPKSNFPPCRKLQYQKVLLQS